MSQVLCDASSVASQMQLLKGQTNPDKHLCCPDGKHHAGCQMNSVTTPWVMCHRQGHGRLKTLVRHGEHNEWLTVCRGLLLWARGRHGRYLIVVSAVDRAACGLLCQNLREELMQVAGHCRDSAHNSSIVPATQSFTKAMHATLAIRLHRATHAPHMTATIRGLAADGQAHGQKKFLHCKMLVLVLRRDKNCIASNSWCRIYVQTLCQGLHLKLGKALYADNKMRSPHPITTAPSPVKQQASSSCTVRSPSDFMEHLTGAACQSQTIMEPAQQDIQAREGNCL